MTLFCVLNEKGQVVAQQLTKGTSFSHVEDLFEGLKERFNKQGVTLEAVYVDNCCHVRNKVVGIFGNSTPVKLDLYHAVSRVTQKIPKLPKHFLTSACIVDFVNVFREDNDKEKDRKQPTPCPEKILVKLKDCVQKWQEMKHGEDEDVLTTRVVHEVECLKKHIKKGCISGIPPAAGSDRYENLNKKPVYHYSMKPLGG